MDNIQPETNLLFIFISLPLFFFLTLYGLQYNNVFFEFLILNSHPLVFIFLGGLFLEIFQDIFVHITQYLNFMLYHYYKSSKTIYFLLFFLKNKKTIISTKPRIKNRLKLLKRCRILQPLLRLLKRYNKTRANRKTPRKYSTHAIQ